MKNWVYEEILPQEMQEPEGTGFPLQVVQYVLVPERVSLGVAYQKAPQRSP